MDQQTTLQKLSLLLSEFYLEDSVHIESKHLISKPKPVKAASITAKETVARPPRAKPTPPPVKKAQTTEKAKPKPPPTAKVPESKMSQMIASMLPQYKLRKKLPSDQLAFEVATQGNIEKNIAELMLFYPKSQEVYIHLFEQMKKAIHSHCSVEYICHETFFSHPLSNELLVSHPPKLLVIDAQSMSESSFFTEHYNPQTKTVHNIPVFLISSWEAFSQNAPLKKQLWNKVVQGL